MTLPDFCFGLLLENNEVILIKRDEAGYYKYHNGTVKGTRESVRDMNEKLDVTPAQAEAMLAGSMFGWDCPGADPNMYDENGRGLEV